MRLFGTAILAVVALAASQSAAQNYEQAIQFTRAKPQDESLRGRNLGRNKKKRKHRHHHEEETQTEGTQIPDDGYEKATRQGNPSCSVCGDGMQVGNPDASVSFPGQSGQIPCGVLENMGIVGLIPEPQCEVLPQLIDSICECESIVSTSTLPTASVVTTTEATKPGGGSAKAGKSTQLSHSMSIPAKAGKSFSGKSPTTKSSGKSNKTVTTKSTSKGSKMIASKASSKAEKSASKSSKSSSTFDAKAEKVTGSSKGAKAATTSESTTAATELATTELATTESTAAASASADSPPSADDPPFLPPTPLPPDDAPPPSVPTQPVEETVTVEETDTVEETTTLELVFTGDGDPPSPLLECQGDCDDDSQCEGTLQCFQRAGDEPVPGCSGDAKTGSDYCARRPTANTVWLKGDDRKPPENFPLGLCEGDCDNDNHCQDGLVCQQRNGDEPIPGCIGNPVKGIDYCRYPDP